MVRVVSIWQKNSRISVMANYKIVSTLDRNFVKSDLFGHLLTATEKSAWQTFKAFCLNFLWNLKAENYKELVEELLNAYLTMVCNMYVTEESFFTFPLGLPSERGSSERRKSGKVPTGYFHHGEKVCRKVVTAHVSCLLLELYWAGAYC